MKKKRLFGAFRAAALMLVMSVIMSLFSLIPAAAEQTYALSIRGTVRYDLGYAALKLINAERAANGTPTLVMDKELMTIAIQRAFEEAVSFEHKRPDGRNCFQGFNYGTACAENLAIGQRSAKEVYKSWNESSAHHNTYLNGKYKSTGLACVIVDGCYLWAEVFDNGTPDRLSEPSNYDTARTVNITKSYESPRITILDWKPGNLYDNFMPSSAPGISGAKANGSSVTLTWSKVGGASGYYLYRLNSKGSPELIKTLSAGTTSYTDSVPSGMNSASYKMKAYRTVGSVMGLSEYSSVTTVKVGTPAPDRVKFTSKTRGKNLIKLKWKPVKCDGYKLYKYNTATHTYKCVVNLKYGKTQYTMRGLKSATKYRFIIRAYNRTASGGYVYGKKSAVMTVTTK